MSDLCNCNCGDMCPLGNTGMEPRCTIEEREKFLRVSEAYYEAWQMSLDFNQPSEVKREWVAKRFALRLELKRLSLRGKLCK